MKRRDAISRILLSFVGVGLTYAGFRTYRLYRNPDINFLVNNELLVELLADTIIPQTDTPGAKMANVGGFIIRMIKDCTPKRTQNNFIAGLMELIDFSDRNYSKTFVECSERERTEILLHFEDAGKTREGVLGKVERKIVGDSFFVILKKYTVLGYCTSEVGATKGFNYDFIPGKYVGIVPLTPGQKAWATQ